MTWESQEEAKVASSGGLSSITAALITDLVFVVVPIAATCVGIWSRGTLTGDQIVGAYTLSITYAAGRAVKS